MSRYTARQARRPGPEMPEQDAEVRRLNEETENEGRATDKAMLDRFYVMAGAAAFVAVAITFLRRRSPPEEKTTERSGKT